MLRNIIFYVLVGLIFSVPLLFGLGNDMVAKDDYHFKNWSYVFMKEFEQGNYDKLYVSVQPGVLTIYSNILGFKGLYFAKDKLDIVQAEGKAFDTLLHFSQKLPKVLTIIFLGIVIAYLLTKITNKKFSFLFILLLALEPYLIGQARVIQTDALPMYIGFLALLLLYYYRNQNSKKTIFMILIGFLVGLSVLEKSMYFFLALIITLEVIYRAITTKNWKFYFREILYFNLTLLFTLATLFPSFWGDFLFTLYRITIGSFIFGIQGFDTETFSYEKTHHIRPALYYLRFLLSKVSETVWIGIIIAVASLKKSSVKAFFQKYNLLFIYPLMLFVLLMASEKKIGRYLVALYPYLILLATVGYCKFLSSKKIYFVFIFAFFALRIVQSIFYYPDFLMYQNPLSPDKSFDNASEAWGSGRKKLSFYISKTYGENKIIYTGDYTTMDMFYSGSVFNKEDYICGSKIDLLITLSPREIICNKEVYATDTYEPYNNLEFYIYTFD